MIKKLDQQAFAKVIKNSKIIMNDNNGPKVLKLANGKYLKIFRLKHWFSSALFYHYGQRFIDNAKKLQQRGITTIKITDSFIIPKKFLKNSHRTMAVEYDFLPGTTLRELIAHNNFTENNLVDFSKFIAKLHQLGIYFRAGHFGNIIYDSKHNIFGLIDVENLKFYDKSLNIKKRQRNFAQMQRYDVDKNWFIANKKNFQDIYFQSSKISNFDVIN
ncbi:MAG: hypothetical protein KBD64_03065 [Gammaproteobacteria bacterium]|nr:hypothetical protein [Gammaproteobacteria bacterium]